MAFSPDDLDAGVNKPRRMPPSAPRGVKTLFRAVPPQGMSCLRRHLRHDSLSSVLQAYAPAAAVFLSQGPSQPWPVCSLRNYRRIRHGTRREERDASSRVMQRAAFRPPSRPTLRLSARLCRPWLAANIDRPVYGLSVRTMLPLRATVPPGAIDAPNLVEPGSRSRPHRGARCVAQGLRVTTAPHSACFERLALPPTTEQTTSLLSLAGDTSSAPSCQRPNSKTSNHIVFCNCHWVARSSS